MIDTQYTSKECKAVMAMAKDMYGVLPNKVRYSIWACWIGEGTEEDSIILKDYGVKVTHIGIALYDSGIFE